jgi:recombination protein RecR
MLTGSFLKLKDGLKKLPGIGEKTATRLGLFLIRMPREEAQSIGEAIIETINSYTKCQFCNILTEEQPTFAQTPSETSQCSA